MNGPAQQQRLAALKDQYDIAIIGGGIYGAATAWEAASRGLRAVLLEVGDFGSGTSANSLKTVHGGLRSLQRLDFPEMREYIRERRALLRIAPHLVAPMRCVMPTYPELTSSRLFLGAGMQLYDVVALDRNRGLDQARHIPATGFVSPKQLARDAPAFDTSNVTGGALWYDAQAYNSERLVLSFVMSAARAGADTCNYVRKLNYTSEHGKITGVDALDQFTGEKLHVAARAVIDCTGPWADSDDLFTETTGQAARPELMASAVNLVLDRQLSDCAVGARPADEVGQGSRLLFIAPWRKGSIVGTWYYPGGAGLSKRSMPEAELTSCLQQVESLFPAMKLNRENVTQIHHGLQPARSAKTANSEPKLWRHTKIFKADRGPISAGLYWVQGVKLTTARATAEKVVNRVAAYLDTEIRPSTSSATALYGGDITDFREFENLMTGRLGDLCSAETTTRLIRNYGSNLDAIIRLYENDRSLARCVPGTSDTIRAEIDYILEQEMVHTLSDLMLRRTDIGSLACPEVEAIEYCANVMSDRFEWNSVTRTENIRQLLQNYPEWCCSHAQVYFAI